MSIFHERLSKKSNHDDIILSFHESILRKSDIKLLQGPHWLNDLLISFYFEYLEKIYFKGYPHLLFVPPQVTQCIKICVPQEMGVFLEPLKVAEHDFVFFALNDHENAASSGGTHWSLLVYSRRENKLFHFDSYNSANHNQAWEFGTRLLEAFGKAKNGQFEDVRCLAQTNGYDCGLHLICNTENVGQYVLKYGKVEGVGCISEYGVLGKRKDLLHLIESLYNEGYTVRN